MLTCCASPDNNVNVKLLADDVKLYSCIDSVSSVDALQRCINNIVRWATIWQLTLSVRNCNVLALAHMHYNNFYTNADILLPTVDSKIVLWVIMDSRMTFKLDIDIFCTRVKQRTAMIRHNFYSRDAHLMIKAFNSFVRPILEYYSSILVPYLAEYVENIEYKGISPRNCVASSINHIQNALSTWKKEALLQILCYIIKYAVTL